MSWQAVAGVCCSGYSYTSHYQGSILYLSTTTQLENYFSFACLSGDRYALSVSLSDFASNDTPPSHFVVL